MKPEIKIVIGALFGDEGKGNTVSWLCHQALENCKSVAVVRFSGGPQAAHRTVYGNLEHISSSYGSGVLLNIPTYYVNPNNTFIDPIAIMEEKKVLETKGFILYPQLTFPHNEVRWITPYDIIANHLNKKVLEDGSCGKGIYTTFKRYQQNYFNNDPDCILAAARDFWNIEKDDYLDRKFKQCYYQLLSRQDNKSLEDYDVLIYEGTQGLLLDMDSEFYPNVTPSHVGLQTLQHLLSEDAEVYFCMRAYLTRHGNGYKPTGNIKYNFNIDDKCNPYNKFQGDMKYGYFDFNLLKKALSTQNCGKAKVNFVVTHCDTIINKVPYIVEHKFFMKPLQEFINELKLLLPNVNVFGSFSDRSNLYISL